MRWASPPESACAGRSAPRRVGGDGSAGGARGAPVAQGQLDVAADRRGEQQRALWRVGQSAAQGRVAARHRDAVDADLPGSRLVDPGQQSQQGGLAGAVEAEQAEAFAGDDLEVVDSQDLAPAAAVADVVDGQDCAHAAPRCCTEVSTALTAKASASSTAP